MALGGWALIGHGDISEWFVTRQEYVVKRNRHFRNSFASGTKKGNVMVARKEGVTCCVFTEKKKK